MSRRARSSSCATRRLNLLSLGSSAAEHLGVSVRALERRVYLASAIVVGAIVSFTGLIGFVRAPRPARAPAAWSGRRTRAHARLAFGFGGAALVLCDLVSRASFRWLHREPPVGAITALIAEGLFIYLLVRRRSPRAAGGCSRPP